MEISALELKALLDGGKALRLIDCREPEEFAICRIEGAELIPFSRFAEEAQARLSDKEEAIVIYCHAGIRSARSAHYLLGLGYRSVLSLAGGIEAWSLDVDPSVPRY